MSIPKFTVGETAILDGELSEGTTALLRGRKIPIRGTEVVILEVEPELPYAADAAMRPFTFNMPVYTVEIEPQRHAWVIEAALKKLPPGGIGTFGSMRQIFRATGWEPKALMPGNRLFKHTGHDVNNLGCNCGYCQYLRNKK